MVDDGHVANSGARPYVGTVPVVCPDSHTDSVYCRVTHLILPDRADREIQYILSPVIITPPTLREV